MLQCDWVAVTWCILTNCQDGFESSQVFLILNTAIVHNLTVYLYISPPIESWFPTILLLHSFSSQLFFCAIIRSYVMESLIFKRLSRSFGAGYFLEKENYL